MPISRFSSSVRLTWVLVEEWQTRVSGPPSDVAERATRSASTIVVDTTVVGQLDGEHRAGVAHLPLGEVVLRMRRQPG